MKSIKYWLYGIILSLVSQFVSIISVIIWLEIDNTEYGLGGGMVMMGLYFGINFIIQLIGCIFWLSKNKSMKQIIIIILELIILQIVFSMIASQIIAIKAKAIMSENELMIIDRYYISN